MRIVNRIIAMSRVIRLGRQFREVERAMRALPRSMRKQMATLVLREMGQASRCEYPHLYGTPPEERYSPWGSGTEIGIARVRSDNPHVRIRGIALWLAVAYHETKSAPNGTAEGLHRQLLRIMREMKELLAANVAGDAHPGADWAASSAVA